MAVVSSITNVIGAALGWRAEDVDTLLRRVVTQLGGVAWMNGLPNFATGNLDSANFLASMVPAIGTDMLQKSRHYRSLLFVADRNPYSTTPMVTNSVASGRISIERACLAVAGYSSASEVSGFVAIRVNGREVARVTLPTYTPAASRSTSVTMASSSCSFSLVPGDEVAVDFSTLTCGAGTYLFYDRQLVLLGTGENSP